MRSSLWKSGSSPRRTPHCGTTEARHEARHASGEQATPSAHVSYPRGGQGGQRALTVTNPRQRSKGAARPRRSARQREPPSPVRSPLHFERHAPLRGPHRPSAPPCVLRLAAPGCAVAVRCGGGRGANSRLVLLPAHERAARLREVPQLEAAARKWQQSHRPAVAQAISAPP